MKRVVLAVAAVGLMAGAVVLLNQVRGGPAAPRKPDSPLTDVAPQARAAPVKPGERPEARQARPGAATQPTAPPIKVKLPSEMPDPSRPPQWTEPLAQPPPPRPPDPFVPPPEHVDPERGRTENAP